MLRLVKHFIGQEFKIEHIKDKPVQYNKYSQQYLSPPFTVAENIDHGRNEKDQADHSYPPNVFTDEISNIDGISFLAARKGHDEINTEDFCSKKNQ